MNDRKDENYFPSNSTLNANVQPEKISDLLPQNTGSPTPQPLTPKQGKFTCSICGAEFSNQEDFRVHLKKEHSR